MNKKELISNLINFFKRFESILDKKGEEEIIRDATIQRFKFAIELLWKTMKRLLQYEKENVETPREVIKKAYKLKWINDEKIWLSMLDDRNSTSHTYNEKLSEEIYRRIKTYYKELKSTIDILENKYT